MTPLRSAALIFITLVASVHFAEAAGDAYPVRPIKLMIPASKGGGADVSFRILAAAMEPILGQTIEIVNKPAGSGAEGLAELAKAPPDGYVLGGVWNGPLTASPQIRKLAYSLGSFDAVASTFEADYVLCAHQDFPAGTGAELLNQLRQRPLGYSYANEGKGGSGYFAAELLFEDLGVLMRGQGFDGSADAAKNFAEGKVDFYFGTLTAIAPKIKTAEAKCLVTLSEHRTDPLPQAATAQELGAPFRQSSLWRLIIGPKGLPRDRIAKLEVAIRKAIDAPAMQTFFAGNAERAFVHGGAWTMARLKGEFDAFSQLADHLGLKAE